jgi:hypothetical protein
MTTPVANSDTQTGKRRYQLPSIAVLALWVIVFAIYPWYRYYLDPDGTSYLTIAQRYAYGDYIKAINGLWSPWACWLTALLIRTGLQPIPAAIIINTLGASGFLLVGYSLFGRFAIAEKAKQLLTATLVVFLCFAVYCQTFNDLWQCFFTLTILRIMLGVHYTRSPLLWMATGIIGALAYFAKAYSLPFFVLNTVVCTWFITGGDLRQWFKIVSVSVFTILVCSFPWMYALHLKYGIWTSSTAGPLNMSWYLVGHPEWKEGINVLLPPAHSDSPYYWEDPWFANGHLSHFWDSRHLMVRQILRFGLNCFVLVLCMLELSVFFPLIGWMIVNKTLRIKQFLTMATNEKVLYLSLLILPAGYILVHLESRYLWYAVVPGMIIGALYIQRYKFRTEQIRNYVLVMFCGSFILYPVWRLVAMHNTGKMEYEFAQKMNAAGIKNADFVSNLHPRLLSKIAYFSGNHFYVVSRQKPAPTVQEQLQQKAENTQQLTADINRYRIKYYLYAPSRSGLMLNPGFNEIFYENLKDKTGLINGRLVVQDTATGISLYRIGQ